MADSKPIWRNAGLALAGAVVALLLTRHGVWAGTDSATYVSVARNLRAGKGATSEFFTAIDGVTFDDGIRLIGRTPLLLWPPLYPAAMAALGTVTGAVEGAAHLIDVVSFAVLALTTGAITRRLAFGRWGAAYSAAALVTLSQWVLWVGSGIYSDLPFLALSGVAVLRLLDFERNRSPSTLMGFTLLAAAACLTRYVGAGLPLAALFVILTLRTTSLRWRLAHAAVAVAALLPLIGWMLVRSHGLEYHAHEVRLHLPSSQFGNLATAAGSWVRPDGLDGLWGWFAALSLAVLLAGTLFLGARGVIARRIEVRSGSRQDAVPRPQAPLVEPDAARVVRAIVAAYLVVLLLASGTVGERGALDVRITLPLLPPIMSVVVAAVWGSVYRFRACPFSSDAVNRWARRAPAPILAVFLAVTLASESTGQLANPAAGLEGRALGSAPSRLRDITAEYPLVVASSPSTFYSLTGRPAAPMPVLAWPSTGEPNPDFEKEMDRLCDLAQRHKAVIVITMFDALLDPTSNATPPAVVERVGLDPLDTIDGMNVIGTRELQPDMQANRSAQYCRRAS